MVRYGILLALILFIHLGLVGQTIQLQKGDIIFRENTSDGLSEAINRVTQTEKDHHFSHMGIVVMAGDTTWIIHAAPKKGVVKETLEMFLKSKPGRSIHGYAFRLKEEYLFSIPQAISKAETYLGQPYDFTYILESEGVYCSELIYTIFETADIFELEPMTFKDASTGKYPKAWKKHYQDLGIPIPEGMPGCNPNGMASNVKLIELGMITHTIK